MNNAIEKGARIVGVAAAIGGAVRGAEAHPSAQDIAQALQDTPPAIILPGTASFQESLLPPVVNSETVLVGEPNPPNKPEQQGESLQYYLDHAIQPKTLVKLDDVPLPQDLSDPVFQKALTENPLYGYFKGKYDLAKDFLIKTKGAKPEDLVLEVALFPKTEADGRPQVVLGLRNKADRSLHLFLDDTFTKVTSFTPIPDADGKPTRQLFVGMTMRDEKIIPLLLTAQDGKTPDGFMSVDPSGKLVFVPLPGGGEDAATPEPLKKDHLLLAKNVEPGASSNTEFSLETYTYQPGDAVEIKPTGKKPYATSNKESWKMTITRGGKKYDVPIVDMKTGGSVDPLGMVDHPPKKDDQIPSHVYPVNAIYLGKTETFTKNINGYDMQFHSFTVAIPSKDGSSALVTELAVVDEWGIPFSRGTGTSPVIPVSDAFKHFSEIHVGSQMGFQIVSFLSEETLNSIMKKYKFDCAGKDAALCQKGLGLQSEQAEQNFTNPKYIYDWWTKKDTKGFVMKDGHPLVDNVSVIVIVPPPGTVLTSSEENQQPTAWIPSNKPVELLLSRERIHPNTPNLSDARAVFWSGNPRAPRKRDYPVT